MKSMTKKLIHKITPKIRVIPRIFSLLEDDPYLLYRILTSPE
jgi:hypothetical protein